jgi:hypothetical protein
MTRDIMSNGPEVQYVPHYEDQDGFTPVRTYGTPYREKETGVFHKEGKMKLSK